MADISTFDKFFDKFPPKSGFQTKRRNMALKRHKGTSKRSEIASEVKPESKYCSSQPSIVYWLSSSIFPCLFVGFFVRRPALVTVSFLNFLLFLLRFCLFRKNSLLLQTFSSFSLSVFFSSAKKYISSLNIFPLFPLCLSSPPQRIYFPFLKIRFGHNF